jgi:glutamate-1-semialdehyde 2,1-aminomutase
MTPAVYERLHALCTRLAEGLRSVIARHALGWCVTQVGARCEFQFCATPPRNGSEAEAAMDPSLEQAIHLALLNRDVMITPFHNMMLVCPDTSEADVDRLLGAFDEVLGELVRVG